MTPGKVTVGFEVGRAVEFKDCHKREQVFGQVTTARPVKIPSERSHFLAVAGHLIDLLDLLL